MSCEKRTCFALRPVQMKWHEWWAEQRWCCTPRMVPSNSRRTDLSSSVLIILSLRFYCVVIIIIFFFHSVLWVLLLHFLCSVTSMQCLFSSPVRRAKGRSDSVIDTAGGSQWGSPNNTCLYSLGFNSQRQAWYHLKWQGMNKGMPYCSPVWHKSYWT